MWFSVQSWLLSSQVRAEAEQVNGIQAESMYANTDA